MQRKFFGKNNKQTETSSWSLLIINKAENDSPHIQLYKYVMEFKIFFSYFFVFLFIFFFIFLQMDSI